MGKIKRERQKFHITSETKPPVSKDTKPPASKTKKSGAKKVSALQLDAVENIFAGINIQLDAINKFPDEADAAPLQPIKETVPEEQEDREIDGKLTEIQWNFKMSAAEKQLTKKEKLKLKRSKLMEKIDVTQQARIKSQEKRQQKKTKSATQSPLPSRAEIKSILTPAAMKPAAMKPATNTIEESGKEVAKNVFAVPTFDDDLPALSNIFKINPVKVAKSSKAISKGKDKSKSKQKQHFVKNYNLMKKLMAKKAKK